MGLARSPPPTPARYSWSAWTYSCTVKRASITAVLRIDENQDVEEGGGKGVKIGAGAGKRAGECC
eukprot:18429-Eustigmatos_ZCMA.PRE.2